MVDGLLANVGVGIVSPFRSSSLTTNLSVTDPVARGVVEFLDNDFWGESNVEN